MSGTRAERVNWTQALHSRSSQPSPGVGGAHMEGMMGAPHGRVSFPGRNFYAECRRMLRRQRGEEGRGSTPQAEGTDSAKALGAGRISQTGCWLVLPRDSPHRSIFQAGLQTEGEENSPGTLPGRSSSPACSPGPLMVRPATVPPGGSPCVRLGFPTTDGPHLAREGQEAGPKKSPGSRLQPPGRDGTGAEKRRARAWTGRGQ